MTRDEILNMEAGREMDALIALTAMGFGRAIAEYTFTSNGTHILKGQEYICDKDGHAYIPNYSTDITDAWQIVEKLENQDPQILCNISRISDDGTRAGLKWHCHLRAIDGANTYFYAVAETVPLAICAAALLASQGGA